MTQFNPYHKWLAIPLKDQPANYYRLLGLELFESDPDVIESLSELRMTFVRQFDKGAHVELSRRIVAELSAARQCLLTPARKASYDAELRAQLDCTRPPPAVSPVPEIVPVSDPSPHPSPVTPTPSRAIAAPQVIEISDDAIIDTPVSITRRGKLQRKPEPLWTRTAVLSCFVLTLIYALWQIPHLLFPGHRLATVRKQATDGGTAGQEREDNDLKLSLCWCPGGAFMMGSPESESSRDQDEAQVEVSLRAGYWIGKFEVTQSQWQRLMKSSPWKRTTEPVKAGDDTPATNIRWNEANLFCQKLTEIELQAGRLPKNWVYRLPTEAEWESACRAGTVTPFHFGHDESQLREYAWYGANAADLNESFPHPVKRKKGNQWNLYDLHGNVAEWCLDCYAKSLPGGDNPLVMTNDLKRIVRGGDFEQPATNCRAAYRRSEPKNSRSNALGFRIVLAQPEIAGHAQLACQRVHRTALVSCEEELLRSFDQELEQARASSDLFDLIEREMTTFEQYGTIPFSPHMRTATLAYLKHLQLADQTVAQELDALIQEQSQANTPTRVVELKAQKDRLLTPRLVGAWQCTGINFRGNFTWHLFSDGTMSGAGNSWIINASQMVLTVRPGGPPGGFKDRCSIAADGQSFVAVNQFGGRYRAVRVDVVNAGL